jgi:23S rRNA (uracil1939-C5)-methyltransferase
MIDLRVQRLATGGDGIGFHPDDGRAVFVRGGLPGDLWRGPAKAIGSQALMLVDGERLEDGPLRIAPRCASRPQCGGCNWHEMPAAAALDAKRQFLIDSLRRVAGYEGELACELMEPSGAAVGGRHRVGLKVAKEGLAYMAPGSNKLVPFRKCSALAPELETVMLGVAEALPLLPPGLVSLSASLSADGKSSAARLTLIDGLTVPAERYLCQAVLRETALDGVWMSSDRGAVEHGVVHVKGLIGTGYNKRYRVRGGTFHQASPLINASLLKEVVKACEVERKQRMVDMHGGAGNFGLVLAANGADVTLAEIDPWVVEDLELNVAAFKGRGQVYTAAMNAAEALQRCARRGPVSAVVFDAPRTGDPIGAARIAQVLPRRVIALGCDPASFARDLKIMGLGSSYSLTSLRIWDAFPDTHHSESMAVLERKD